MAILFDDVNRIITIEAPQTEVTCQELLNACREFEDDWNGIDDAQIAEASGKQNLGGGKQVGITLESHTSISRETCIISILTIGKRTGKVLPQPWPYRRKESSRAESAFCNSP